MTSLLPIPEPPDPVEGALGHFEHSNWVKQALKNLDEGTVHSNGGVATGTLLADQVTIDNPEDQTARLNLKGNITKSVLSKTSADLSRWELVLGDATAEGGNHSGSLFSLLAYADAGTLRHTVLKADRNTGLVEVKDSPTTAKGVATKEYVDLQLPIGAIIAFGGTVIPTGWHQCDGTAHGSSALQTVLGSATTPDLRGRFIVAVGDSTHVDVPSVYNRGDAGGKESVALSIAQLPSHDHGGFVGWMNQNASHGHIGSTNVDGSHSHVVSGYSPNLNGILGSAYVFGATSDEVFGFHLIGGGDHAHAFAANNSNVDHQHTINAQGSGSGHENRPPYYALIYIIKKA